MALEFELALARGFAVEQCDLPGAGTPIRYVPSGREGAGRDGPLLEVRTDDGLTWIALFADGGLGSSRPLRRVIAMPDGRCFCVVTDGAAYIADAHRPDETIEARCVPVVSCLIASDLLILTSFSYFTAYRGQREAWTTTDLVADELEVLDVDGEVLTARGFDPTNSRDEYPTFTVDLTTGLAPNAPGY